MWLGIAVAVLAVALTAQTVHVLVTPKSVGKRGIDAARHSRLMSSEPGKQAPASLRPREKPKPSAADFRPLGTAGAAHTGGFDARSSMESGSAPPASQAGSAPIDQAVVSSQTPTLSVNPVTDPSGGTVLYCFRVTTGADGMSGETVDSGCQTTALWTIPAGTLHDGGTYTWTVLTAIQGGVTSTTPPWLNHFRFDQRLGDGKISPTDQFGPFAVNLYNGNVYTDGGGPTFHSVGGESGVKLAYNSLGGSGGGNGVTATYFNDPTHTGTPAAQPVMVRNESMVNLYRALFSEVNGGAPLGPAVAPALDPQWYVVRWEGWLQAPVDGDYRLDGGYADGMRLWVNGIQQINDPNGTRSTDLNTADAFNSARDVTLSAGQRLSFKVELLHHSTGDPKMQLWARAVTGPSTNRTFVMQPQQVQTPLLYPTTTAYLPAGWSLSMAGSKYMTARYTDGSVVLTDDTGAVHTWAKASDGGYVPPVGEDGVVAIDSTTGMITHTDGGVASVFNVDGTLKTVTSVLDSKKPAALQYNYSAAATGLPPRLTTITDPVSGRSHTLYYNTDNSNNCYGGAAAPPGAVNAPSNMLCRIKYWDGTETRLWYSAWRTLDRIENPGGEVRDFTWALMCEDNSDPAIGFTCSDKATLPNDPMLRETYISQVGPMMSQRSALANDWLATQTGFSGTGDRTSVGYAQYQDQSKQMVLRPLAMIGPATDGRTFSTQRQRQYGFGDYANYMRTQVRDATGALSNVVRTAAYDDEGRATTTTDADNLTISGEWNAKDKPTASIDTAGRRSTNLYDHADRLIDSYGPAPATCFTGQVPTVACAGTVPHTHVNYDEGITGLQAALYDNPSLSGIPAQWQTGVGTSDGSLSGNWANAPPVANTAGWSGRFTGEIQFPTAGTYSLGFTAVDGVRLWVDDVRLVDSWTDKPSTSVTGSYTNITAGSWHRLRVDYYNRSGNTGALNFTWTPPGASGAVTIPGQNLAPRYGLETSRVVDDTSGGSVERAPSKRSATSYTDAANGIDPVFGLTVSTTADPGGINLTRPTSYERPGTGYLRAVATALPAGDITNPDKRSTTTYYGDNETRVNPCDASAPAANQAGMAKTVTAAKNSAGAANTAESVYDSAGRVIASRLNAEPWSCVQYDARGRVTQKSFPAMGSQPARTIAYTYAVNGNPLVTQSSDASGPTTATTDLVGQLVAYTDANGITSTAQYDIQGRMTSDTATIGGVTSTLNYYWDNASRLTRVDLDGVTIATLGFDTAGQIANVAYGNGSRLDSITRNAQGTPTAYTWKTSSSTVTDAVTRSLDQRITDESVTDTATSGTFASSYTYDGLGRLVAAAVPHHQLTYGFAATGGCGPATNAGLNTNRTSATDSQDGAAVASTGYCYDGADRLLSSTGGTALSFTYDTYGNTSKIGSDTLGYDSTRRHITTQTAAGVSVQYTRDVTDRLTARTVTGAPDTSKNTTTRYGYTAPTGSPDFVLDSAGKLQQRILKLPGGVVLTKTYTGTPSTNWSYPNSHGDISFTADGTAARTGTLHVYDPYGQNIDPATGNIGDIPIPATMTGGMDYGWLGANTVPIEHLASHQALEMGARTYLPTLGRFLQTDPVAGGSANDYDYTNADPINSFDLSGDMPGWVDKTITVTTQVAEVVSYVPGPIGSVASGVQAAGLTAKGDYAGAAVAAVGMIPGGKYATTAIKAESKAAQVVEKAAAAAEKTCNSFTPDTLVVMGDGTSKPISQIRPGDMVLVTDPATGTTSTRPVADLITGQGTRHLVDIGIEGSPVAITATAGHPIWVENRGWVDAAELKTGDIVRGTPGTGRATVAWIRDRGEVAGQTVNNLSVIGIHTYYVNAGVRRVLVHNCAAPKGSSNYTDVTSKGARMSNRSTDMSRGEFEKNLEANGWNKDQRGGPKNVTNYEKDGAKYSVRDNATSTGGPSADYYQPGSDKPDLKLRLDDGS